MADSPMIIDGMGNSGFGGAGLGAGFIGGLVLGSIWNGGGWGGWGNRGVAPAQVGADVTIANSLEHISDQVSQAALSQQQLASNQNMFMGNLINQTGDAIVGAVNQGTFTGLQNTAQISDKLCCINNNITSQGYENRLQSQALAAQMQNQCCQLSHEIFEQGCQNRELQREIQAQAIRDKLAETQAKNAALEAQINLQGQLQAQTLYLINQLKPATTAATGA